MEIPSQGFLFAFAGASELLPLGSSLEFSCGRLGTNSVWRPFGSPLGFAIPGDSFSGIPPCFPPLGFTLIVRSQGTTFSPVGGLLFFYFLGELHVRELYEDFKKQTSHRQTTSRHDSFCMSISEHINGLASTIECKCDKKNKTNASVTIIFLFIFLSEPNIILVRPNMQHSHGTLSTSNGQPMADYVSGTDLSTFFWGGLGDKRLLKVPLSSKLSPRDEGADTQVEKGKRYKKKCWKGQDHPRE